MLKGKNIVLGVTGGIAVYKACEVVSRLKKLNANVDVIMTEGAEEFVTPLTFQTMSKNVVHRKMFNEITSYDVEHISLAQKADIILIAPATANTIGKIANGIADNLLTTVVMASTAKVIFAPAMNTFMYRNPIVKSNIDKLKNLGYEFISPGTGLLACGDYGEGKMPEPSDIIEYVLNSFIEKDLVGKKIVITAGPTIEPLDPVRYMTNHSSGKMGYNIAKEAVERGAEVILVSGPTSLVPPKGVNLINIKTTEDMLNAIDARFDTCNVLIKAAAPADYRPETVSEEKIKKKDNDNELIIKYIKNPDIVAHFGNKKEDQIIVGFAAETNNIYEHAVEKIKKKNLDFIVANDVTKEGAGFNVDTNIVSIIDKEGIKTDYPIMDKRQVAKLILDKVKSILEYKS
ncbi:bifunctional phosphopantothenoylcysteine decarboxylase/phosphopantothenate--cysteine ligase CoaBC [Tissierella pigra]|uniref:Coenzyme A biosynthesis bifunctional protein CoaBC n=1 Tax=Tissierella pigra TaxID=2607614 RepID=A0A6N7XUS9_9FIRM|nr:bifunctional phosphopantothenoylcysteine decarboxylase/phosphopantothenate--cysteine ligase CoaBC [Tissierella pigra]MBU5426475.1 bifunctional phosphopantothenoylcysteine decarboxylase/phosphopantothenate--cysteine ligase CoaBC [Tissierella pigra]MSU00078.1 bifunctional phosphopantothenoylcysteine decarboxylase/phosphopantothenate--cysteine ligase CoaBC [Tissierella pigra]